MKQNCFIAALFSVIFSILGIQPIEGKNPADESIYNNYMLSSAGTSAGSGSYLVRVSVTTKNSKLSDADMSRCAVHGVLFKGFSGENTHMEKPLAGKPSIEAEHSEFFNNFFETQASGYASPLPSTRSVTKTDKKKYVVTQVVEVKKDLLRKTLQDAGVIRSLNSGF